MFEEVRQGKDWNNNDSSYNSNNYSKKTRSTRNNNKGTKNNSTSDQDSTSSSSNSDWRKRLEESRKKWEKEDQIRKENRLQFEKNLAIDYINFLLDLWGVSENELNQSLGGINWRTEINNTSDWLEISRKERSLKDVINKIREEKELAKDKIDAVEHINSLINIHSKNYSSEEKQELKDKLGNWKYDLCRASSDSELWSKKQQLQGYGGKIEKAANEIHQKRLEKIKDIKTSSIPKYRQRTNSSARRGNRLVGLVFLMIIIGSIVGIVMYFRNKKRKSEENN